MLRKEWSQMARYRLTRKADRDIENHYEYGIRNFGLDKAQIYILDMHERFVTLADNPVLGRGAKELSKNLRRLEYGAHVIFYLPEDSGVLIVRVLRKEMDFPQHF